MTTGEIEPAAEAPGQRRGGYAVLVAAGIFLSRIAGLVRQGVLTYFLGTTGAMSAFTAAQRIPNFLQNLLGEGVLSASMIPVYSRLLAENDRKTASRVAGTIASVLALVVAVIVVAGVLFAPLLVDLLAPGFEGDVRALTIAIVRIIFPGIGLLVLSAWCLAVLNSHRMFFIPYVAPVLWSLATVAAVLLFARGASAERAAIVASWGLLAGCVLQLLVQIPFVRRAAPDIRLAFDTALAPVRQVFRNFGPVVLGRGVVQVSAFVDEIFASFLSEAAMGAVGLAYTVYLLPFSLFGMSVSAAELPQMSSVTGSLAEIHEKLRARLRAGLRQIEFFVVPSAIAFLTIGDVLVAALYQRGRFSTQSTHYVWIILIGYALGLVAGTKARLYSSAFYALNDAKTPLRFAMVRVAATALLGWALAFPLRPWLAALVERTLGLPRMDDAPLAVGAAGLAAASGIVSWIEYGLLRRGLQRKVGPVPSDGGFHARIWGSGLAAALAGLAVARMAIPSLAPGLHPIPAAIATAGAFGLTYLAAAMALGVKETGAITRRLRRR